MSTERHEVSLQTVPAGSVRGVDQDPVREVGPGIPFQPQHDGAAVLSTGEDSLGHPPGQSGALRRVKKDDLQGLTGDHEGVYYPLTGMSKDVQNQLIDDHFLFKAIENIFRFPT